MTIDLHNHTVRCNHAEGTVEQYIQKAIDEGIDIFGFADHAPMDFDEKYRMGFEEMAEYEAEIREAAQTYEDRILIRLGYEVDWLPGHMDERVLNAEVDFLIGSVHFLSGWGFDNPEFIGHWKEQNVDEVWERYFAEIAEMARSRRFEIVGHLDLIKVFGHKPERDIRELAEEALDAIAAAEMSLELNAAGWRKPVAEAYPSLDLLRMAYDRKIPITFASDAHKPEQVGWKMRDLKLLAREAGYSEAASYRNKERQMHKF